MTKTGPVLILTAIGIIFSVPCTAETYAEKVGGATGKYYGSVVMMKLISESKCRASLKNSSAEYDLAGVKAFVRARIARYISREELMQVEQHFAYIEKDAYKTFGPMLSAATPAQCQEFTEGVSAMHSKHYSAWLSLAK